MQWKPEYSMHDAVIDREHQALFDAINRLHEAMLAGQGRDMLAILLGQSAKFAEDHFAREEKMMAETHYPELAAHIQLHEEQRKRIKEMVKRFEDGETTLTIEYALLLSEFLKLHMMVDDRRFTEYVKAEQDFKAYLDPLLHGDHRGCSLLVQRLLSEGIRIKDIYVHIFQRAMYHTGELWMKNQISVATEHLVTAVTLRMMSMIQPRLLLSPRNGKKAVVACVGSELHQMGAQMVSDALELGGWDSYFLGANTPIKDLLDLLGKKQPQVLCLSVSLSSHLGRFHETVKKTRSRYPDMDILVGGQALQRGRVGIVNDSHLHYLRNLDELEAWIARQ
jgi:hemerythrin-like metal-binding protein